MESRNQEGRVGVRWLRLAPLRPRQHPGKTSQCGQENMLAGREEGCFHALGWGWLLERRGNISCWRAFSTTSRHSNFILYHKPGLCRCHPPSPAQESDPDPGGLPCPPAGLRLITSLTHGIFRVWPSTRVRVCSAVLYAEVWSPGPYYQPIEQRTQTGWPVAHC